MDPETRKALQALMNLIRVGQVSSVNEVKGTVRVKFGDKDNLISPELSLFSSEYDIPPIGSQVLCLFLPNGLQQGFCLNGFYSDVNPPPVQDKNIYFKAFGDGTTLKYDRQVKELEIVAAGRVNINAAGNVNITGDLTVQGNINASGTIIDVGGNTNHHTHPA
ncbi:phage baseplate assembly protein V [Desulfosporosinus sp. FKB]|uniref:phage baseplate assembly protein V n=1 Tax=Desulfosporosinus sp. FKB TaxID=1969835 RepID=UPI000B49C3EF|nr:phage baseplate assembly protein V [Desulfosporosinus sp. FKB]